MSAAAAAAAATAAYVSLLLALQGLLEPLRLVLLLLHELLPLLTEERQERGLLLGAYGREQLRLLPLLLQLLVLVLPEELQQGVGGPLSLPHGEQPLGEPRG